MLKKVSLGLVPVALIGIILIFYVHSILIDYNNDLLESYGQRVSATLFEITTQSYNISGKVAYDLGLWEFLSANHKTENAERAAINNLDIFENYNYD